MLHGGNKQFVFKSRPAIVDGENYNVEIKIKKTPVENKFYIHNMNLLNKNDTVTQVSNDVENVPQSYVRNELVSPVSKDNVTQNKISVNNETNQILKLQPYIDCWEMTTL